MVIMYEITAIRLELKYTKLNRVLSSDDNENFYLKADIFMNFLLKAISSVLFQEIIMAQTRAHCLWL